MPKNYGLWMLIEPVSKMLSLDKPFTFPMTINKKLKGDDEAGGMVAA